MQAEVDRCRLQIAHRLGSLVFLFVVIHSLSLSKAIASEPRAVRAFYNQFSDDDEKRLGDAMAGRIERDGIPVPDREGKTRVLRIKRDLALENYLQNLAARLARSSQRPEVQYQIRVLDASAVVNAWSIPGAHIYVTSGMLDFCQSESELAAVLAHEIGHVVGRHVINRVARVSLFAALINQAHNVGLIADAATAQRLADMAMPIVFALDAHTPFSRDDEIEADLLGLHELDRAGWATTGETSLLQRLAKASPQQDMLSTLLATHPDPLERLAAVRQEINTGSVHDGIIESSAEFSAMKRAMHPETESAAQSQVPLLIAMTLCIATVIAGVIWAARRRTISGRV